jgi:hypothetical protein
MFGFSPAAAPAGKRIPAWRSARSAELAAGLVA